MPFKNRAYIGTALEGNGFSKLAQAIQRTGYNENIDFTYATVVKALPKIEIRLDGDGLVLHREVITLPDYLVPHYQLHNGTRVLVDPQLKVGDRLTVVWDHHDMTCYVLYRTARGYESIEQMDGGLFDE